MTEHFPEIEKLEEPTVIMALLSRYKCTDRFLEVHLLLNLFRSASPLKSFLEVIVSRFVKKRRVSLKLFIYNSDV